MGVRTLKISVARRLATRASTVTSETSGFCAKLAQTRILMINLRIINHSMSILEQNQRVGSFIIRDASISNSGSLDVNFKLALTVQDGLHQGGHLIKL